MNAAGASAQVVYHVGVPVGTSVDFRLYKNDPDIYQRFFAPESYPGGLSYSVSLEGSYLVQTLEDPDVFGPRCPRGPPRWRCRRARSGTCCACTVLALYRSLSFIQFEVPGFPPFQDFPDGHEAEAGDVRRGVARLPLPTLHLTPGFILGVQQPAAYRSPEPSWAATTRRRG